MKKLLLIFIAIITLTIGFSAFSNNLYIDGISATVRIKSDVRITGISIDSSNEAISSYEDYNVNNISGRITLSDESSYIIYDVNITNLGNIDTAIESITGSNENLNYEILDYNLKDPLCDNSNNCTLGITKTIKVKISYKNYDASSLTQDFTLTFNWYDFTKNPISISINKTEGDTTENALGAPFTLTVINHISQDITFSLSSSNSFNTYDESGNISSYTVSSKETKAIPIYIKELSTAIFSSTTQNTILTANITNMDTAEDISIDTLTLTLPSLPKYKLIKDGFTDENENKPDYSSSSSGTGGLYKTNGIDGNDAYFYRGNVNNNYVSFAGLTWRILQIDSEGNLRVILNSLATTSKWQSSNSVSSIDDSITLVHYNNSTAKTTLESWYSSNLASYKDRIVQSKFCVDTSYSTKTSSSTQSSVYYYASYLAVGPDSGTYNPTLTCDSDKIVTSNIGLISAEEVVMAGGAFEKTNSSYFLYNSNISSTWWTISPAYYDSSQKKSSVFVVTSAGKITDWADSTLITSTYGLRPVITLDGSYEATGSGTSTDPYVY